MNKTFKTILLALLITTFMSSCGRKKDNFEIDLSKIKLPQNKKILY